MEASRGTPEGISENDLRVVPEKNVRESLQNLCRNFKRISRRGPTKIS